MIDRPRPKVPRAVETSDVARPRSLAIAALGAAAGAAIAVAADHTPLATGRAIARPHSKVPCASCHADLATSGSLAVVTSTSARRPPEPQAVAACIHCHGAHGSTRAAHRQLAASGDLTCAICHAQHGGAQGVTFEESAVLRWGAGSEERVSSSRPSGLAPGVIPPRTTVPLVSVAVCATCHDASRADDPLSACVPASARRADAGSALREVASRCFDEHRGSDDPGARGADRIASGLGADGVGPAAPVRTPVCQEQHGPARFVVWDAAREIAATTAWVTAKDRGRPPWLPAAGALVGALTLGLGAGMIERRRRGSGARDVPAALVPATRKRLPVIDPSTCLGCYACVDACPFDVLAVERYVAVVARPEECCGVVLCEQVCPNGSLRVEDGERILDRPALDEHLESRDVPGLFLAGDLTGLPLIKNAINQGARAIDRIAATLPRRRTEPIDVLVIGAGPAGLSAALRAKERGLSSVVVEQATIAASIQSFPRDKIVHDPPIHLPVEGELWLKQATKEELLAQWKRIVRSRGLDVREGHRVIDVRGAGATPSLDSQRFIVTAVRSDDGEQVHLRASRVLVAIGRRGTPRRLELDVEPGAEDRVAYALADARSFQSKRVVVVGLGDSAMEAALALSRQPGTSVTISYRGARFRRGKAKLIAELESLVARKKLRILYETIPVAMTKSSVVLAVTGPQGGQVRVGADAMLVLIGGLPSWDLLTRVGMRRPRRQDTSSVGVPTGDEE